jgi:hypothetical protein
MFTCQNKGSHLFVEVSGLYSLELLMSTVHKVADHCREENLNKALIDLRNMQGDPSILDRYKVGIEIANVWGPRIKAAVIAKADVIDHMGENTAVNRGANLTVTSDEDQALKWLGIEK